MQTQVMPETGTAADLPAEMTHLKLPAKDEIMAAAGNKAPQVRNAGARRPRGTGANFVYEGLRNAMLSLELEPGTLLDETELAQRYNISRSPVREALIRLSAEGLVTTLRNRSSVVASLDLREVISFFDALDLMYRVTARSAATMASPDDVERIKEAATAHRTAIESGSRQAFIESNRDFHIAIAKSCGNSYFVQWTRTLLDSGQRIQHLYWQKLGAQLSDHAHCRIVDAIAAGDADAAEAAGRHDAELASEAIRILFAKRQEGVGLEPLSARRGWSG
jgi:DNA-binding GntR family transcriptional regulator